MVEQEQHPTTWGLNSRLKELGPQFLGGLVFFNDKTKNFRSAATLEP
jgi:hypothetical protein